MYGSRAARELFWHLFVLILMLMLMVVVMLRRYILIAFSEILASITGLEYAFTKAPRNMRSLVMSVFLFMSAASAAIGEAFVCTSFSSSIIVC